MMIWVSCQFKPWKLSHCPSPNDINRTFTSGMTREQWTLRIPTKTVSSCYRVSFRLRSDCRQITFVSNQIFKTDCLHCYLQVIRSCVCPGPFCTGSCGNHGDIRNCMLVTWHFNMEAWEMRIHCLVLQKNGTVKSQGRTPICVVFTAQLAAAWLWLDSMCGELWLMQKTLWNLRHSCIYKYRYPNGITFKTTKRGSDPECKHLCQSIRINQKNCAALNSMKLYQALVLIK